jgi:hypothetical protein
MRKCPGCDDKEIDEDESYCDMCWEKYANSEMQE